ncbi:MAG: hypothetical protein GY821_18075 [Gammaproteobacteria bacterium]|nr:hypothetical protein [Gammaproteobacteria bacterium]
MKLQTTPNKQGPNNKTALSRAGCASLLCIGRQIALMILTLRKVLLIRDKTGDITPKTLSLPRGLSLLVEIKILTNLQNLKALSEVFNKDLVIIIQTLIKGVAKVITLKGIETQIGVIIDRHHKEVLMRAHIGEISHQGPLIQTQIQVSITEALLW